MRTRERERERAITMLPSLFHYAISILFLSRSLYLPRCYPSSWTIFLPLFEWVKKRQTCSLANIHECHVLHLISGFSFLRRTINEWLTLLNYHYFNEWCWWGTTWFYEACTECNQIYDHKLAGIDLSPHIFLLLACPYINIFEKIPRVKKKIMNFVIDRRERLIKIGSCYCFDDKCPETRTLLSFNLSPLHFVTRLQF